MILLVESEGPDQSAGAQADLGLRYLHMPEDVFAWHRPYSKRALFLQWSSYINIIISEIRKSI